MGLLLINHSLLFSVSISISSPLRCKRCQHSNHHFLSLFLLHSTFSLFLLDLLPTRSLSSINGHCHPPSPPPPPHPHLDRPFPNGQLLCRSKRRPPSCFHRFWALLPPRMEQFHPPGTSSASSYPYQLKRTHGSLNLFGWGVLLPIGAMFARYGKRMDPLWYYIHALVQFTGFIIGLAGVVAGVALNNKLHHPEDVSAHRGLGIFILVLGILQVIAFFLRPDKDSKIRRYWNWYHHGVGRLTLFLAAVNIFLGIQVGGGGTSWKVGYSINLAILIVSTIILEIFLWTSWSHKTVAPPTY